MKKISLLFILLFGLFVSSNAQSDLLKSAKKLVGGGKSNAGSGLSNDEIIGGLKEALTLGAQKSAGRLSVVDGFFKDAVVKILLPPEAQKVEKTLRNLGMGNLVDDAILRMNRAAEDASKSAATIFVDAVKKMSVNDALGILRGPDTAATSYLKKTTTPQLTSSFRPVIDSSLQKTDATKYWKTVFETYNKLPTTFKKVNPDLSSYVTEKALSGIFYYVAQEEAKIRKDPAAQATDLLKKVFGGK
jgi:hypothetical protein